MSLKPANNLPANNLPTNNQKDSFKKQLIEKELLDKQQLDLLMAELNSKIDKLIDYLASDNKLALVGYETQPVSNQEQNKALAQGQAFIEVTTYGCDTDTGTDTGTGTGTDSSDKSHILNYFKRFYAAHQASTRFVSRMPGIINCHLPAQKVIGLVKQINDIKDNIKILVQTDRNHHQRHQFIHDAIPTVMTEQLYRHIHCTQMPIKSLWFGWRLKRQTNKSLTHPQAIELLHNHIDKPKGDIDPKQWQAMINAAINSIHNSPTVKIQQLREYKTHPTCAYSYYDSQEQLKRGKISIAMPWILLDQPNVQLPVRTPLKSFDSKDYRAHNQAKPHISIFDPLKLIGLMP